MNITDVKIRHLQSQGRIKAIVSVTVDNQVAIHEIRVIEGHDRLFVAMPSRHGNSGDFRDIVQPITSKARQELEDAVLSHYFACISDISDTMDLS